jgi:hypothetical protein
MLSFLHPWLWCGLIAVGAPLWLHLRRKERENIIRFSTLRFLEDQPIARQSPLQLRNLLLFFLRLLAVLALVAAFAQPFFTRRTGAVSSSDIYVLDNTLSRQAEHGLEHDRAFLLRQLRDAGPRRQIAVVEMAAQPKVIVGFGDDPEQAAAKLNALQPTAQRGTMVAALREANFLIQQSLGEHKHITILTDSQTNQWEEDSCSPPFLPPGLVSLAPGGGLDSRPNFFVGEPRLQRVFLGDKAVVEFTAQAGHSGNVSAAALKLTVNGQDILEHAIKMDNQTSQVSIAAQWESDPSVWLVGDLHVSAQPDDLPQDDTAYFTLPPVTEGRVALLTQSVYLKTALSTAVARGHWSAQLLRPADLPDLAAAPGAPAGDVLMIDADYLQANAGRELVDRYIQSGRGVFVMMDRDSPLLNGFLQKIGFQPALAAPMDTEPVLQPIRYFVPESPIFLPFTTPDFSNLLEVRILDRVHLHALAAKPLLFSQNGDALLFELPPVPGRMLLSTFAFERSQTDWVVHPSFVPFLDSALQYLRPQPQLSQTLEPGQVWVAQLPPDDHPPTAVLRDLTGKELARTAVDPDHHRATFPAPDQPGVYSLTYDADPRIRQMLAVNPSLKESDLNYLNGTPPVLKAWTLSSSQPAPVQASAVLLATAQASQQIVWWGLLLVAALALFAETLWAAQSRRTS